MLCRAGKAISKALFHGSVEYDNLMNVGRQEFQAVFREAGLDEFRIIEGFQAERSDPFCAWFRFGDNADSWFVEKRECGFQRSGDVVSVTLGPWFRGKIHDTPSLTLLDS